MSSITNLTNVPNPLSVNVTTEKLKRLIWDTETDWNKGDLGTDVEVVGTGASAKIAPKTTVWPGTEIYLLWHFNETSGVDVADSSYNNRDGVITTPEPYLPASFTAGKLNNAFTCPGESEAQSFSNGGDIANFEWNDLFSLDCWINITPGYEFMTIAGKYNATQQKGWFLAIQDGYLLFELVGNRDTSNWLQVYSDIQITASTFQHVAVTYDGTGVAAGVKFYLDGVLLNNSVYQDTLGEVSIVATSTNFGVGPIFDTGWGFIGQIDEFTLYTVVLSQANVDFRYNAGAGTETPLFTQNIYPTTAHYETNIADSEITDQLWGGFNFMRTTPSGTTAVVKCRVSDDANVMGSYGAALVPGDDIGLNGQFIQFSVDFTGTTTVRAEVDYISSLFVAPDVEDVSP